MDRCPNCGSSVRIGAKFCTTCGFRLPVQPPIQTDHPHARSPFDTTSTAYVASRWPTIGDPEPTEPSAVESAPGSPPVEDQIVETSDAETAEPVEADSVVAAESVEPTPFTGWPAYGSGFGQRPEWSGSTDDAETKPVEGDVEPLKTVEDAIFAWSGVAVEEPAVDEAPKIGSDAVIEDVESEATAAAERSDSSLTDLELESEQFFAAVNEASSQLEAELPMAGEATEPESVAEEIEIAEIADLAEFDESQETAQLVESVASGDDQESFLAEDSPVERAKRLVAELGDLLALLGTGTRGTGVGSSGVADALAASRSVSETDAAALQSLRAAVATAQARPRDVDVMLDLVARADAIAAVFRAHDRYATAIDTAVSALRGEQKDEPKPLW